MKSLKAIQVFTKIGRILSKIVFICCIVGVCGCITATVSLAVCGSVGVKFNGSTLEQIIVDQTKVSLNTMIIGCNVAMIICAGECVIAKFGELYFKHESEAGTPFTDKGCKELCRLGIIATAIPVVTSTICAIFVAIAKATMADVTDVSFDIMGGIGVGLVILLFALLCKYGTDALANNGEAQNESQNETQKPFPEE